MRTPHFGSRDTNQPITHLSCLEGVGGAARDADGASVAVPPACRNLETGREKFKENSDLENVKKRVKKVHQ